MRGVCYENAMLWHTGSPHSQIVGPVTYMWRPFSRESSKLEAKEGDLSNSQTRYDKGSCNSLQRQLWIWIHAAALDEGLDAIRFACEKQMQDSGVVVNCCSLEGKIARLEVMGSKAMQSLKSILHPIIQVWSTGYFVQVIRLNQLILLSIPQKHLSSIMLRFSSLVLYYSMIVRDPREVSFQGTYSPLNTVPNQENNLLEGGDLGLNADEAPSEERPILSSRQMHPGRHDLFLSDCREMWDSSCKINPPVAEEVLCMEKHHRRIKFFCLDSGDDQGQATQTKDYFS